MRPQPLIAVTDVEASSRWYQKVLGCRSDHGGKEYERLVSDRGLILQLHHFNVEHDHGRIGDIHDRPYGNGVLLWFEIDDFDAAVQRARDLNVTVVLEPHRNPPDGNGGPDHREFWFHDPDGYTVVLASPDGEASRWEQSLQREHSSRLPATAQRQKNERLSGDGLSQMIDKPELYARLQKELIAVFEGERDFIANMANCASLLFRAVPDLNWAGFYRTIGNDLVLGPFQGPPACIRIGAGRGVCGTAAERQKTIIVPDVNQFPGHIACDAASQSEIVVPLILGSRVIGVLDLDSPRLNNFDDDDATGLEALVSVLLQASEL